MRAEPAAPGRIRTLDVLRGIAILGTFAANVWVFAAPSGPATAFLGGAGAGPVEAVLRSLANGKFLAMLTLLFGVGIGLQYASAVRRGLPWPGRYPWRAAVLLVEGLLHYVFVFEFDVLMGYAVASVVVAYLVGRSRRVQALAASVAGAVLLLLVGAVTAAGPDGGPGPAYPPDYPGQVLVRLTQWGLYRSELVMIVPGAIALFLAGAALVRAGAFAATPAGARVRGWMTAAGAVGAAAHVVTSTTGPALFAVERYVCAPLVACGIAALVTTALLRVRGDAGPARRGLVAIGRTALSCYVLQNVVAGVLFHPWGLDLATRLAAGDPGVRVTVVVTVWALVCAGSAATATPWLRRFDRGPVELVSHAVWRSVPVLTRR